MEFFDSINTNPFSGPQWEHLFRIYESLYRELVREFFATYVFGAATCRHDPRAAGIQFRLGGELRSLSFVEFCWRISLYSRFREIFWDFNPTCDWSLEYWALRLDHQEEIFGCIGDPLELVSGECHWVRTRGAQQQHEQEEEDEANEDDAGSSRDVY
nr:hypothetical protein [Tanacetum cinerariifolium]